MPNTASPAAVTSSVPTSSRSASGRGKRNGIRYMTKATASGGPTEVLSAVRAAPPVTTSASTARGQRRRNAAGSTASAVAAVADTGMPGR